MWWQDFCELYERDQWTYDADDLEAYVAFLYTWGSMQACYIRCYVSAVKSIIKVRGSTPVAFDEEQVRRALRGVQRISPCERRQRSALLYSKMFAKVDWPEFAPRVRSGVIHWQLALDIFILLMGMYFGWRASSLYHM